MLFVLNQEGYNNGATKIFLWREAISFRHIGHDEEGQEGWWPSEHVHIKINYILIFFLMI
jgi:hypothetical protein